MFRVQSRPHKAEETRERGSHQEAAAVTGEGAGLRSPAPLCFHQGCSRGGGDRPTRLKKPSLSGGPQPSMRAEPTTSPEMSPKESCQRRFGSSKHQGRIDANANTAQRLRHGLASAA